MKYYILEPEVAGGFGENTIMDPTSRPPRVTRFHYEFDGWLGDELLETVACFIATKSSCRHPPAVAIQQVLSSTKWKLRNLRPLMNCIQVGNCQNSSGSRKYGAWAPIGAEQTASGYYVAWKAAGADQYAAWRTDSNGSYISNFTGTVSGEKRSTESAGDHFPSGSRR